MICDTCIDRDDCRIRRSRGKHDEECKSYFPDWTIDRRAEGPVNRSRPAQTKEA